MSGVKVTFVTSANITKLYLEHSEGDNDDLTASGGEGLEAPLYPGGVVPSR